MQNSEVNPSPRRRALYIRHKKSKPLADFQIKIEDSWSEALALHCDLHIVDEDFDYGEMCERINPDFTVLEDPGGYRPEPVRIRNPKARPDIPKIGFLIQDAHDTGRVSFLRALDEMKIERFFVMTTAAFRQSPEMAGRVFTLPRFFDDAVFHDYGLEKIIPISLFGGLTGPDFYQWRVHNVKRMFGLFPLMVYAHPGYTDPIAPHFYPIMGADYAKMINRSHFSMADPSRSDIVVYKHLEIPAAGAVLIAPQFQELAFYGFRDMENCILGTDIELFHKIAAVAADPELYKKLCKNGHDLVQARFTRQKWRAIPDWYECYRHLRPGEMVQQQGVFGNFTGVPARSDIPALQENSIADSAFSTAMKTAWHILLSGRNPQEAEKILSEVTAWLEHYNEPYILLGIAALLRGQVEEARARFYKSYDVRAARDKITFWDPEELAWLWLAGLIERNPAVTEKIRGEALGINHLSLRRMEALDAALTGHVEIKPSQQLFERQVGDRLSIHWTGQLPWVEWLKLINRILAANDKA